MLASQRTQGNQLALDVEDRRVPIRHRPPSRSRRISTQPLDHAVFVEVDPERALQSADDKGVDVQRLVLHPVALRVGRRAQPDIGRQTDDTVVAPGIDAAGETVHVPGLPVGPGVFTHLADEDVAALHGLDVDVIDQPRRDVGAGLVAARLALVGTEDREPVIAQLRRQPQIVRLLGGGEHRTRQIELHRVAPVISRAPRWKVR